MPESGLFGGETYIVERRSTVSIVEHRATLALARADQIGQILLVYGAVRSSPCIVAALRLQRAVELRLTWMAVVCRVNQPDVNTIAANLPYRRSCHRKRLFDSSLLTTCPWREVRISRRHLYIGRLP